MDAVTRAADEVRQRLYEVFGTEVMATLEATKGHRLERGDTLLATLEAKHQQGMVDWARLRAAVQWGAPHTRDEMSQPELRYYPGTWEEVKAQLPDPDRVRLLIFDATSTMLARMSRMKDPKVDKIASRGIAQLLSVQATPIGYCVEQRDGGWTRITIFGYVDDRLPVHPAFDGDEEAFGRAMRAYLEQQKELGAPYQPAIAAVLRDVIASYPNDPQPGGSPPPMLFGYQRKRTGES